MDKTQAALASLTIGACHAHNGDCALSALAEVGADGDGDGFVGLRKATHQITGLTEY